MESTTLQPNTTSANLNRRKFSKKFSIYKNDKKFRKIFRKYSKIIFFENFRKIFRNNAKIFLKNFESKIFAKVFEILRKKNSTDLRIKVQNRRSVQTFIIVYQFSQTFEKFCIFYFSYTVYCTIIFFYS